MRFPWQKDPELDRRVREERGRLAKVISQNSIVQNRLETHFREGSVSAMLEDVFRRLEEGKK